MNEDNRRNSGLPDMEVSKGRDVLSKLFRLVLANQHIEGPNWESLMERLLNDPKNPMPRNSKDRSSQKGNLNKALKAERMTWKTFEKGLRFLTVRKARVIVELTWANQKTTCHYIDRYLGNFTAEDFVLTDEEEKLVERQHTQSDTVPRSLILDPPEAKNLERSIRSAVKALDEVSRMSGATRNIPLRRRRDAQSDHTES